MNSNGIFIILFFIYFYIFPYIFIILVVMEGRKYSHDSVDTTGINVMLNTKDVSEYLKISPNGLEVSFGNIIYWVIFTYRKASCYSFYCIFRLGVMHIHLKV